MCSGSPIPFPKKQIYSPVVAFVRAETRVLFRLFAIPSFFGDKRPQLLASAGCSARGLFAPLGSDARRAAVLAVLVFEGVRIGQGSQGMVLL